MRKQSRLLLIGLVLSLNAPGPAVAAPASPADSAPRLMRSAELDGALSLLDRWLDAHRAYAAIPAISVGIVHDQDLIWQKSYGFANPAREIRATAETLYSICSISKVFAGIGVMQQRAAGALDLDDPVAEHL
ncbi:MAG: serine hydrolase domain-containing protein, partial [Gammaproteobacteria bacterium]